MAISLSDAAKRFGMDIKTEAQDNTAPTALTPEQLEEGKKGYEKFIEDQKNNMPWYDKVENAIGDVLSSISIWAHTQMFGSVLNPWADKEEKNKELPYAISPEKPSADWSDEERNTFGYLYTQDANEAAKYAIRIYNKYNAEAQERLNKVSETTAKETPVLGSIASVALAPTSMVGMLGTARDYAISKKYGETVKSADYVSALNHQSTRGAIANQLNASGTLSDDLWAIGGKGWGDVYSLGMSIADSLFLGAGTITGAGMLLNRATYFSRSATEGYNDAISRGLSPDTAGLYGVIIGAIECLTESTSDKLLANVGKDQAKGLLGEVLRQAGQEGVEEFVSALVDALAQEGLFGENSDRQRLIKYYMSEFNMSHEEASNRALVDLAGEIVFAGLGGALSGGVSAGTVGGLKTAWNKSSVNPLNQTATKELAPIQDKLFESGKTIEDGTSRATIDKLSQKKESGKELSGYDLRKLHSAVTEGQETDTKNNVKLAIAERLKDKGVKIEDIPALTKIILSKALGENLTKVQQIKLKNNEIATAVSNEMDATNMLSGNFDSQWAIDAGINKIRDVSGVIQTALAEANKADVAEGSTTALNLSTEAREALRGKFTGLNSAYTPQSENTHIHTDEIKSTTLDAKQTAQIRAIERVANALGVDFYIYESEYSKKDGRKYVDKDGNVITDSGYYDPRDNSIHIDLHAGQNGEGTMLYTASHELVHWIKKSAADQFEALKDFVLGSLKKEGVQIDTLIEKQINKAKENGRDMDLDGAIEEIVADACMTVLTTDAGIKAVTNLKTENKGLWNALKRFFTQFFNRIDKMYKGVKVDSEEGQYLADMHETAKKLRDLFVEGAQTAAKSSETKQTKTETVERKSSARAGTVDSNGNALTEQQQAYFKDSKVRDAEGNLLVVYHGSPSKFTMFDHRKLNTHGNAHGRGFYFTETKGLAESYSKEGGQLLEGYLDIKNPMSEERVTIKRSALVRLIKESCKEQAKSLVADEGYSSITKALPDTWVSNYVMTYGMSMDDVYREVADIIYDSSDNDVDIIAEMTNAGAGNEATLRLTRKILGYDGVIYTNEAYSGHEFVIFESNQFKNIDNKTPTTNPDIRYSARKRITPEMDASYLDAVNRGDTETAQRMVDEAAKATGYTIKAYHATNAQFNAFDISKTSDINWHGRGIYFTNSQRDVENNYENYEAPDPWQKIEAEAYELLYDKYGYSYEDTLDNDFDIINKLNECYDEVIDKFKTTLRRVTAYLKFDNPLVIGKHEQIRDYDMTQYDGIIDKHVSETIAQSGMDENTVHYIVLNPAHIKSAEAITYDDNGNVIPLSERFNSEQSDIRYSSRKKRTVTLSVGEEAKFRANYTRSKVFSKSNMYRIIEKFASKGELAGKTVDELADDMWISFNTATSVEERREFAHSTAQFVVSKLLQESKSQSKEAVAATEQLLYLKGGIRRIDFTPDEITEIRFKKDESGLKSIRARWGYHKSHTNAKVRPYPLDVFVTDVAREVPGMAYLADMNHVDAFFEIADMYDTLKAKVKDRWVSNYAETSNSDLDALQMEIEQTIFDAYITEGEQSKFGKFVSAKLDAYKERTEYWKAAYDNFKDRSRLENLITYKAQKMEDLKKGTFLNATQYGNADAFKDSIEKLSSLKFRGAIRKPNAVRDIFKPILAWYTKDNPMLIDPKADEASPHKYSYEVAAMLEVIANGENGLSNDELAAIYEIMNYFTKFIETYNKVWRNGKWEDAIGIATTDIEIMQHVAKSNTMSALKRAANKYAELFSEPMFVARMSDGYQNGFFTQTMTELREAAKNAAIAEMEVREDYDKFLKEHPEYVEKASTEMVEFKGVQIPKMQLISLYMTYHRKHAQAGLIFNGFKFTTQPAKVGEVARTIAIPGATSPNADLSQAEFNALVKMEITLIRSKLNATDKEYIKMLEGLYNGQLRALKVQRDMDRLGFTNATLDYYYPIRRATIAKSIDTTVFEDVNRATNSSFNKNTVKGARQQLFIESADTLINKHIHEICNYAYMSGAIENYNVIYNLDVSGNPNNPVSVRTTIEATNLWTSSQKYFHKLVKDMQGIKSGDDTVINSALGWLRSGYVKFQLGLNLKTIASQASSIYAATNVLDYGSIVKGMGVDATGVDDYCAYAKLRHYDKSAIKAMTVTEKIGKKTEWVTAGIEAMDRLIITKLFGACQVQAEKNGAGKIGTEENKIAAGKLLEKVILDTQSNALATEKSSAMRSESEVAKMLTMFRADSMKVVTRVFESVGELRMLKANNASETEIKGAQVKVAKSVASLVMVSAFMATLAQLFRWIYNKEQDEDRVLVDVAFDFAGNLLSGVPLLSDLWDYFIDGFEPSSMALDVVFTLAGGVNSITKDLFDAIFSEDKPSRQKIMRDLRTVLYGACQFAGIPVRNVYNMVTGVIGNISSKAEYRIDDFFNENNYYSDLKEAIEKEDLAKVDLLFSLAYGKQFGSSVSDATVEELNRLAKLGKDYRVLPKTIPDKITRDGIEYELTDNQKQDILTQYEKVNAAIDKLITLSSYKSLSDEKKVERLKYYYDKYFDLAVTSALGLAKSNEQLMYLAVGFDTYAKFHFATKGIKSDKDKNGNTISGSKRKKTIQAIDKLKLPEEKRLILIASKGYALTENERSKLVRYINGLKLSATTKNALAELCGFEVKNGKIVNK